MLAPKSMIIEEIFRDPTRWKDGVLIRPIVTMGEVQKAIGAYNRVTGAKMSDRNPANFFKDFVRSATRAEENWPPSVLKEGYTATQRTGGSNSFEFIQLPEGQTTAFASLGALYPKFPEKAHWETLQTLSLDVMVKALARKDENWLQRIAVDLNVPQAHFALHPHESLEFEQVAHIQSNLKLRKAEIDGLYYGYLKGGRIALITMEAKGDNDDILESQMLSQVDAIQKMKAVIKLLSFMKTTPELTVILPMAMKIVRPDRIQAPSKSDRFAPSGRRSLYMAHYHSVPFLASVPSSLQILGETIFTMRPPIPGVNG